jgi:hypothetical protein
MSRTGGDERVMVVTDEVAQAIYRVKFAADGKRLLDIHLVQATQNSLAFTRSAARPLRSCT